MNGAVEGVPNHSALLMEALAAPLPVEATRNALTKGTGLHRKRFAKRAGQTNPGCTKMHPTVRTTRRYRARKADTTTRALPKQSYDAIGDA